MFFRKRKKVKTKNPNVSKVNLIIIGFLALLFAHNYSKDQPILGKKTPEEIKDSILQVTPSAPIDINNLGGILPVSTPMMSIKDVKTGNGEPAVCGQEISISYTASTSDDKPIDDSATEDKPLVFRIGEHKVMPAFEQGVVGMRKSGQRIVFSPAANAYDSKGFGREDVPKDTRVQFTVEMIDITPPLPNSDDNVFRIFSVQKGVGHTILCGDEAKARITVWDVAGKKLFPTKEDEKKPISFTTGKSEVFLGLEQGVIGITTGSRRTLIVPPDISRQY